MKKIFTNIYYIAALFFLLSVTLAAVTYFKTNISSENRLTDLSLYFLYPTSYTLAGAAAAAFAARAIADNVLETYNRRLSDGLSKRVIQLMGNDKLSRQIEGALRQSALVSNEIIHNEENVSPRADLIVLSFSSTSHSDKNNETSFKPGPEKDNETPNQTDTTSGERDINEEAQKLLSTILGDLKKNGDSQGLIFLTTDHLNNELDALKELKKRNFSTMVNAQGRVLSDIHSLLTTLPLRNRE